MRFIQETLSVFVRCRLDRQWMRWNCFDACTRFGVCLPNSFRDNKNNKKKAYKLKVIFSLKRRLLQYKGLRFGTFKQQLRTNDRCTQIHSQHKTLLTKCSKTVDSLARSLWGYCWCHVCCMRCMDNALCTVVLLNGSHVLHCVSLYLTFAEYGSFCSSIEVQHFHSVSRTKK